MSKTTTGYEVAAWLEKQIAKCVTDSRAKTYRRESDEFCKLHHRWQAAIEMKIHLYELGILAEFPINDVVERHLFVCHTVR